MCALYIGFKNERLTIKLKDWDFYNNEYEKEA